MYAVNVIQCFTNSFCFHPYFLGYAMEIPSMKYVCFSIVKGEGLKEHYCFNEIGFQQNECFG